MSPFKPIFQQASFGRVGVNNAIDFVLFFPLFYLVIIRDSPGLPGEVTLWIKLIGITDNSQHMETFQILFTLMKVYSF